MEKNEIFFLITLFSLLLLVASGAVAFGQTHDLGSDITIFWTIFTQELLNKLFFSRFAE